MIHHELGHSYVLGDGGPEGVEAHTPLDALLAAEGEGVGSEAMTVALEAVRALHAWVCDQGPHPRRIAERLVMATQHYAPDMVCTLVELDRLAVMGAPERREVALMRVLLGAPKAGVKSTRAHVERITSALGKAHRREGHVWQQPGAGARLEVLIAEDMLAGAAEEAIRREAVRRWLRPVWQGGALGDALKNFYALTRSFWPELVLNMTGEEISAFFVQTRAAESERVHRLVNRRVERHCGRHTTLRFQKSTTACGKYAQAQKGNSHRASSVKRAA